jgi:nudix-type nucleoside diphosphatase (YffH/AdpP family)
VSDDSDDHVRVREKQFLYRGWASLARYTIDVRTRDGGTQEVVREIEDHGNSAAVLPFDRDRGMLLLTRQFRLAAHLNGHSGWLIEACAGMIDDGESAEAAALREAREELGFALQAVIRFGDVFVSPGASMERATLFTASYTPADRISAGGGVDHGEDIEVLEMPLAEAALRIADGTIVDAKTIILIQATLLREKK